MYIENKIKQVRSEHKNIIKEVASLLDKHKISYVFPNPAEIKAAQSTRKDIMKIVCQLPLNQCDIDILIDVVETKKATYIRKK